MCAFVFFDNIVKLYGGKWGPETSIRHSDEGAV